MKQIDILKLAKIQLYKQQEDCIKMIKEYKSTPIMLEGAKQALDNIHGKIFKILILIDKEEKGVTQ